MTPIPNKFTGDDPLVHPLNKFRENLQERTPLDGESIKWKKTPGGFVPIVDIPTPEGSSEIEQFRVVHHRKDYVTGYRITVSDDQLTVTEDTSELVRIAKPFELRATPWDGQTINGAAYVYAANEFGQPALFPDDVLNPYWARRVSYGPDVLEVDGTDPTGNVTFQEHIFPRYEGGRSIIYAMRVKQGPLFTVRETPAPVTAPEVFTDYEIEWVDLNLDARRFEPDFHLLKVCLQNTNGTSETGFVALRTSRII